MFTRFMQTLAFSQSYTRIHTRDVHADRIFRDLVARILPSLIIIVSKKII
jgi:hypothetical protein